MCKISIISPVYNVELYLEECIQSILNQSFTDFEVIFINDGSTDSSYEILKKYEALDRRIRVFDKQNEGQGVARNFALPYAKGDYVLYLDPDDWLEKDALAEIYNKFQEENYDVIFFNPYFYYEETGIRNQHRFVDCFYCRFKEGSFNSKTASDILFSTNGMSFKAYNREFLVKNNIKYSPTRYIEDSEFFIKAVLCAQKMSCLNKFIVNYRIRETSSRSTTHHNIDVIKQTFYVCEKILNDFDVDKDLLNSFLKNRVQQLLHHYYRVQNKYRSQYYTMMKEIFVYINQKYGSEFIDKSTLDIDFNLVIKNSYLQFWFKKWLISIRIQMQFYFI